MDNKGTLIELLVLHDNLTCPKFLFNVDNMGLSIILP